MKIDTTLRPSLAAISGGLGDIGRAIALTLSQNGADIALGDIKSVEAADDISSRISATGRRCFYAPMDVSDPEAVSHWYEKVSQYFGDIPNLIIPNAATVTLKPHLEISCEEWRRELDVNLNGAFYFADCGTRKLVTKGSPGRVVFIGSWAAHAPHRNLPAYNVAKAGLRMLCKTLALEMASKGILVNEVAPGYVAAGLSGKIFNAHPEIEAQAKAIVPIQKFVSPEQVARHVLFLCSDDSLQMTGATLLQDGGLSLLHGLVQ